MTEMTHGRRIRQLRNLVVMALADGSIGQREVNLVADRCVELGLGEQELQQALKYGLSDDSALELPADRDDQEVLLSDLIRMMAADGKIDESEKRLFALAAAQMKIDAESLDRIISSLASPPSSSSSPATKAGS